VASLQYMLNQVVSKALTRPVVAAYLGVDDDADA
jgi:hypothetical protein